MIKQEVFKFLRNKLIFYLHKIFSLFVSDCKKVLQTKRMKQNNIRKIYALTLCEKKNIFVKLLAIQYESESLYASK